MTLTRRAFLLASCATGVSCVADVTGMASMASFGPRAPRSRLLVIDMELSNHVPLDSRARVTPLTGDVGWLWHEHLRHQAALGIGGITRPADAFVFARFAADLGLLASRRIIDDRAVAWTLAARRIVSLE
jgi:hypothetical protein